MKANEIIIGEGLGELKFGMKFQEVRALLGEPDDIGKSMFEDDETGEETTSEQWTYSELNIVCDFAEEDDYKLGTISVGDTIYLLEGKALIGKTESEVLDFLQSKNWGEFDEEEVEFEDDNAPKGRLISFYNKECELWFEDGRLTEIQFSPLWDSEDNQIWPQLS